MTPSCQLGAWRGDELIRHLAARLDGPDGVADLEYARSAACWPPDPRLLGKDLAFTTRLAAVTGQLIDGGRMSSSARQALAQVC